MKINKQIYASMVIDYNNSLSINIIAKKYMVSEVSVRNILRKSGVYNNHGKFKRWEKKEIDFLKENYPIRGLEFCMESLNRTRWAILSACKKFNIYLGKEILSKIRVSRPKKYVINTNLFFKVRTPEVAYILGLLWADGSLRNGKESRGDNIIRLVLKNEDAIEILKIFETTGNWSIKEFYHKQNKKTYHRIACCDKNLYEYLVSLDYHNKSFVSAEKVLEIIPETLRHYWWLGYIDGDGSFSHKKQGGSYLSMVSTINQDWGFIKYSNLSNYRLIRKSYKNNKHSRIICTSIKNILTFLDWLYQDYKENRIGFTRKYKKYLEIINSKKTKSSKFMGVMFNKVNKNWNAYINKGGKRIYLGSFNEEYAAATAYNQKAIEIYGDKAKLNIINES